MRPQTLVSRAVAKISSCRVYAINRTGIVQLGSSFGSIILLFPTKVAGDHAHSSPQLLSDSPACFNFFPFCVALSQLWSTDEERGVKRVHGWLLVC